MRVITGTARGRKLNTLEGRDVRPTTDQVKEAMFSIMSEDKKDDLTRITLSNDILRKYFPRNYTPLQMQETIIKLLEQWQRKRQQQHER